MRRAALPRAGGFWLVAGVFVLLFFAAAAPSPLYGVYQAQWRFSTATLTAVFGVYALLLLVTLLVFGWASDYLGRRRVILAGLVMAAGGLGTSALVQCGPAPTRLVWWLLLGVSLAAAAAVPAMPETVPGRPGVLASLRPRVAVPRQARATFAIALPCLIAAWMLSGFCLSLGRRWPRRWPARGTCSGAGW
jgi:MFS family permease